MTNRKKLPRRPQISPHSGEGRQIGLDDREIPSGIPHLVNPETPATKPKEIRAQPVIKFEGGVYDQDVDAPYEKPEPGKIHIPAPAALSHEDYAVPVYEVQAPGKGRVHRIALCDSILVPVIPIRICEKDRERVEVRILNEDTANDIRFAEDEATLNEGRGALLWHGTNSYTAISTQDDLWAISVTTPARVSVVQITEVND